MVLLIFFTLTEKIRINQSMYPVALLMSQFGQKIIRYTIIS